MRIPSNFIRTSLLVIMGKEEEDGGTSETKLENTRVELSAFTKHSVADLMIMK